MSCCRQMQKVVRRAIVTPTATVLQHAASTTLPLADVSPGENPNDLNGGPFAVVAAARTSSVPTLSPTARPAVVTTTSPAAPTTTVFASLASTPLSHPLPTSTPIPASTSSPSPASSSDSGQKSSGANKGGIIAGVIILIVALCAAAFFGYRYRKRQKKNTEESRPVKMRPLITTDQISRPTAISRARESFRKSFMLPAGAVGLPATPKAGPPPRTNPRTTGKPDDFYAYRTEIIDSYGSESSYPTTVAPPRESQAWPEFQPPTPYRPQSTQVPMTERPQTRRLQNVPFKIPKSSKASNLQNSRET